MKKEKYDKETECITERIVDEWTDIETGQKHRKILKSVEENNINLGSMKNPKNTDIISIEWRDTSRPKFDGINFRDIFKG